MKTLDSFSDQLRPDDQIPKQPHFPGYKLLRIVQAVNIAGTRQDYFLHVNDVVHVEEWIADLLVKRGAATEVRIPTELDPHGGSA